MNIQEVIKQSKFESPYLKAFVNLLYTHNYMAHIHIQLFAPYDLLPQHYNVLKIIKGKHPEPVTPKQVLEVALDKGRDLTRLVDKLEEQGLVKRRNSERNKRSIEIMLTDYGLEFTLELEKKVSNWMVDVCNLTDEESETLSALLDKMRNDG
jgi:DNA-binding MarR family transcriptional regulator